MTFKYQGKASPLRRIMLARGLTMDQLAVYSGCSVPTIRKIDRMDKKNIGGVNLRSVLKLAVYLEVSPTDLIPFLGVTPKKARASGLNVDDHTRGGGGRPKRITVPGPPPESGQHQTDPATPAENLPGSDSAQSGMHRHVDPEVT